MIVVIGCFSLNIVEWIDPFPANLVRLTVLIVGTGVLDCP